VALIELNKVGGLIARIARPIECKALGTCCSDKSIVIAADFHA